MLDILQNITTGICYRADGEPFGRHEPALGLGTRETIRWRLFSATPEYVPVSQWTPCTDFADGTFAARCSGDADFIGTHSLKLKTALPAGPVTSLDVISTLDPADIPDTGELEFSDNTGTAHQLSYQARTRLPDGFRFQVDAVLTEPVPADTAVEVPDALFFTAPHQEPASSPADGIFVFDLRIDSPKLRRAAAAAGERQMVTLELLIYHIGHTETIEIQRLFCRSAVVNAGIHGRLPGAITPPEQTNEMLVYLRQIAPEYLPSIGENGHWFIGSADTGIAANGSNMPSLPPFRNDDGARLVGNTSGAEWVFGEDNTPLSTSSIMFEDGVLYTADIDGATGIDFYYGAEMEMYDQNFGLRVTQGATPGSLALTCNGDSVWWGNDDSPPHYAADNTPPDISTASRAYMIRLHWDAVGHHLLANLAYTEDV